jgi:predicted MFS family arabinose efflux permease
VTVSALALSIPIAGAIASRLSLRGFLVVFSLDLLCLLIVASGIPESVERSGTAGQPALRESIALLGYAPIRVFLPAWLAINGVVGAWLTLSLVILTYPDRIADARFPGQAIYGGFSQIGASSLVGAFGVLFIVGMGGWVRILPRLSRTRVMLIGLVGLACTCVALSLLNTVGSDPSALMRRLPETLPLVAIASAGILLLSGFPPVALTQMAAIADTLPNRHGAVMGFFSVALGVAQVLGAVLGGLAVDAVGFYGLMLFSALMGVMALGSVLALRRQSLPGLAVAGRE